MARWRCADFAGAAALTFAYANESPKLKAAYSFYGVAADSPEKVKNIACPVYGFYAENDERVDARIPKAEELMKAAGKSRAGHLQGRWPRFHALW